MDTRQRPRRSWQPRANLLAAATLLAAAALALAGCSDDDVGNTKKNKDATAADTTPQPPPPKPGQVVINELYLSPAFPSKTKYFAMDQGMGPDGNPGYDTCDKFVEVVNVSGGKVHLNGVSLHSKSKKVYTFSSLTLEPQAAILLFYRGKLGTMDCTSKKLPAAKSSQVKVVGSSDSYFISASDVQAYLVDSAGKELDRVFYNLAGSAPSGLSIVRKEELAAAPKQGLALIKHPTAACAKARSYDAGVLRLAFSPGTCADGVSGFKTKCMCAKPPADAGPADSKSKQ